MAASRAYEQLLLPCMLLRMLHGRMLEQYKAAPQSHGIARSLAFCALVLA